MKDPDAIKSEWRAMGHAAARDPASWRFTAAPLLRAAELCWHRFEVARNSARDPAAVPGLAVDFLLLRVAMALAAQGVEALLKAIIVARHPQAVDTGEGHFYTHDLLELAKFASVPLSDDEAGLLGRLTELIEWSGRYPVPKWKDEKTRARFDPTVVPHQNGWAIDAATLPGAVSQDLWLRAERLVTRLDQQLGEHSAA